MHIILGILGTIVTILILVNRLKETGIDFGWLNPFSWAHRRKWRKKYHADPALSIESPMESAAGLMFLAAKFSGEVTQEEKLFLLDTYENTFNLSNTQATELLSSLSFIIRDEDTIYNKLEKYLQPSISSYSQEQKDSVISLVESTINISSQPTEKQLKFLNRVRKLMNPKQLSEWQ